MKAKLNRIKAVLVERDISQTQLSQQLGLSFSTINAYCCNRKQPSIEVLVNIAKVVGVDAKELLASTLTTHK